MAKKIFKINLMILLFCFLRISIAETASMPLLKQCTNSGELENVITRFRNIDLKVDIIFFEKLLLSSPSIVGYISISNSDIKKEELVHMLNTLESVCFPINRTVIEKKDGYGEKIVNTIRLNELTGIENNHIVVNKDTVEIYYNRSNRKNIRGNQGVSSQQDQGVRSLEKERRERGKDREDIK